MGIASERDEAMYGIKKRLVSSYFLIILLTVFLFELFMFIAIRQYYLGHIRDSLQNKAEVSAAFYSQYLVDKSLEEQVSSLINSFAETTSAQVQLVGLNGTVLGDSTGISWGESLHTPDIKAALNGSAGEWQGRISETGEPVLSIAVPLKNGGETTGVLRLVTSLVEAYAVIEKTSLVLLLAGVIIIAVSIIISILLSATITKPIREIIKGAEEMAVGKFSVRIKKRNNDELGKLTDTLHYMAAEITRHEQLKNKFISSISHELRTPLTSIKGWVITLLSESPRYDPIVQEGLEIIDKETDRLVLLVEELLDLSKLVEGKITLHITRVNINEWVQQIAKQLTPRTKRQNIQLFIEVAPDLPDIAGDPNRLKQVLLNLLDNALKFTPNGGMIYIFASKTETGIQLSVKDTGTGIPPADLPHIKKRFYKANESSSGSGLGLSICDEIMTLHEGRMEIYSMPRIGTQVDLFFPSTSS